MSGTLANTTCGTHNTFCSVTLEATVTKIRMAMLTAECYHVINRHAAKVISIHNTFNVVVLVMDITIDNFITGSSSAGINLLRCRFWDFLSLRGTRWMDKCAKIHVYRSIFGDFLPKNAKITESANLVAPQEQTTVHQLNILTYESRYVSATWRRHISYNISHLI